MSDIASEDALWHNTRVLVGFTDKNGKAWHNDDALKDRLGLEDNNYPGAIPVEDIERRLFGKLAVYEGEVYSSYPVISDDGVTMTPVIDPTRKAIITKFGDGPARVGGLHSSKYEVHDYMDWLVYYLNDLTSGGLSWSSAGLLSDDQVAFAQAELGETITNPQGVSHKPYILGVTSLNGTIASTTLTGTQIVVCTNTLRVARGEATNAVRIKHTRNSSKRIAETQQALDLVVAVGEDFNAQVKAMCETSVSDAQWTAFLDATVPLTTGGEAKTGRGLTMAENRRDALSTLWNSDERVSPWKNNAFGVLQAVNTYEHWIATVKSGERDAEDARAERNALRKVSGTWDDIDSGTMATLNKVLATV